MALLALPVGRPDHDRRVLRGGGWINNPENARAAARNRNNPDNRDNNLGFRVLLSAYIASGYSYCRGLSTKVYGTQG